MKIIFGLLLLVALAWGQNGIQNFFEAIKVIVETLGKVVQALVSILENIQKWIKDSCDKNGGPGAYENLKKVWSEVIDFYDSHFKGFNQDVKEAKKTGNLSAVIKNYCRLSVPLIQSVQKLSDGAMKCSEIGFRQKLQHFRNMAEKAINYACENDGVRIISFVAEDGIDCVMGDIVSLLKCGGDISFGAFDLPSTIKSFEFNQELCKNYKRIQECMVQTLGKCNKNEPAKLINDFLNEIYKSSPCHSFNDARMLFQVLGALEDGLACLNEKSEELEKCGNDAFPKSTEKLEYDEVKQFQSCVVKTTSTCKQDMPSEIIDTLIDYIYSLST
ncbi:hypothetical protein PPYR_12273 [Photinus pyralis]|uniref:DUF19 domain-containing protein n=1 Tax=Photinus pyralis TaxID=7054 RepID=A0A5N4ADP2_PHOPY|nr:27 kDa hemolymph protein-like [Photinus pyralis]KAB0795434.1 hypothetical protein PPYR_12273 [Photinus pyralis]